MGWKHLADLGKGLPACEAWSTPKCKLRSPCARSTPAPQPARSDASRGLGKSKFYIWREQYGGLGVAELRRLRQREKENCKLKQLVADLSLDQAMLQEVIAKNKRDAPADAVD